MPPLLQYVFFQKKGFVEVHTQNTLSILAACEDPTTVAQYNYEGKVWPFLRLGQNVVGTRSFG